MGQTMRRHTVLFTAHVFALGFPGGAQLAHAQASGAADPVSTLVARLDLQRYKDTIKGLTKFGDRVQGTKRNRDAIDWIEAQLKSYGCTNTERLHYDYAPPNPPTPPAREPVGGAAFKGEHFPVIANTDPEMQPDARLRELNAEVPKPGPREEVYCTKIGSTHPEEMYILGAHMDGRGYGEAANDDGSGTALVMEIARILNGSDVTTERSVRFILWNNEETGHAGAKAYVEQRKDRQGKEDPTGSGKYPEPKWLGMIQHDMMLFDHGMPGKDGLVSERQRPEADINVEFQSRSKLAAQSQELAWTIVAANEKYATDFPAAIGSHMTNTDSADFQDWTPSVSLRELERGSQIGAGWDPTHHEPTDVFSHFSDGDFRLGLNAAQTTLSAVAQLAGAKLK